jgi:hypothetical protein
MGTYFGKCTMLILPLGLLSIEHVSCGLVHRLIFIIAQFLPKQIVAFQFLQFSSRSGQITQSQCNVFTVLLYQFLKLLGGKFCQVIANVI